MKRFVFTSLMSVALILGATGQTVSTTVAVKDTGGTPIPGARVFWFMTQDFYNFGPGTHHIRAFDQTAYTDANGFVTFNYRQPASLDTLTWAVMNCQRQILFGASNPGLIQNDTVTLTLFCGPLPCDVVERVTADSSGLVTASAYPLVDSNQLGSLPGPVKMEWTFDNSTTKTGSTVTYQASPAQSAVQYCYENYQGCQSVCDSVVLPTVPNPLQCQASYYVDTVNTGNFQGQLVLGENSTTASGQIVNYSWDFGDGTVTNGQYPQHTYASVDSIYNVCLTITAVDGNDTCVSTYCDSLGFDTNGDPVYKQAGSFTINVLDPKFFSTAEISLARHFDLFPNPADGEFTLQWDEGIHVKAVQVLDASGQNLRSFQPENGQKASVENLPTGMYFLRITTDQGIARRKLMIR